MKVAKRVFLKGIKKVPSIYVRGIKDMEGNKISVLLRCEYTCIFNYLNEYLYSPMEDK